MRKFVLANQKGGTAKTTSSVNLASCLAHEGKKVLLVDLDPQAHATVYLGFNPYTLEKTLYEVITDDINIKETLLTSEIEGLDLIPSHINLSSAEIELVSHMGRENVLRDKLKVFEKFYDYLIIDCPPSLGLLTINALNAVNQVIIPVQAEFFALEGTGKLVRTIEVVKNRLNKDIEIYKVLITRYDGRKNICKDVAGKIKNHFKKKVFKTKIRDNVKLSESPSYGKPITLYAPSSAGCKDYRELAKEVIKDERKKNRTRK